MDRIGFGWCKPDPSYIPSERLHWCVWRNTDRYFFIVLRYQYYLSLVEYESESLYRKQDVYCLRWNVKCERPLYLISQSRIFLHLYKWPNSVFVLSFRPTPSVKTVSWENVVQFSGHYYLNIVLICFTLLRENIILHTIGNNTIKRRKVLLP